MAIEYNRRIASPTQEAGLSRWWERVTAFLRGSDHVPRDARDPDATAEFALDAVLAATARPGFPIVPRGYDRAAVDESIAGLQAELTEADRELAEVRNRLEGADEVQTELKRIGEQTSSVLISAYEQRDVILREAREAAQSALAESGARASALVADGEARLRELEAKTATVQRERDRLLEEIRAVSAGLAAVADSVETPVAAQP